MGQKKTKLSVDLLPLQSRATSDAPRDRPPPPFHSFLFFFYCKKRPRGSEHTRDGKRNGVINKTETQRYIKVRVFCARIHPFNAAIYPTIKKAEGGIKAERDQRGSLVTKKMKSRRRGTRAFPPRITTLIWRSKE